jgi:hypothetical protein
VSQPVFEEVRDDEIKFICKSIERARKRYDTAKQACDAYETNLRENPPNEWDHTMCINLAESVRRLRSRQNELNNLKWAVEDIKDEIRNAIRKKCLHSHEYNQLERAKMKAYFEWQKILNTLKGTDDEDDEEYYSTTLFNL